MTYLSVYTIKLSYMLMMFRCTLLYTLQMTVAITLQQDLDMLAQWSHTWMMSFNPQKCEFLRVTNKRNYIMHTYYIESTPIKEVLSATYLGVSIDNKLTWNDHIQRIINKVNQINAFYTEIYVTAQVM